jgi:SHS2 domain-containing protein
MKKPYWKEVDHTADSGIEVWANSFPELMLEAAMAISEMTTDIDSIDNTEEHFILVEEEEMDLLLVEFLKELLYLQETKDFIPIGFKKPQHFPTKKAMVFSVTALGGKWDVEKHESKTHIKAVTYHDLQLRIFKRDDWYAKVIFDL